MVRSTPGTWIASDRHSVARRPMGMRRPFIDIALLTAALLLLDGCSGTTRRSLDWTDPPTVSPADASAYVGREVRMVGTVESAEAREGRAVLMLDDRSG